MRADPIAEYEALKPFHYSCICSMRVDWSPYKEDWTLGNMTMDGCTYFPYRIEFVFTALGDYSEALLLVFTGIKLLKMPGSPGSGMGPISVLDIKDVSKDQWEGINYRVLGTEMDGDISFYCHSFTCEIVPIKAQSVGEY